MIDRKMIINGVVVDNRNLEEAKITKTNDYRQQTNYNILVVEGIDEITQINAALGVYEQERIDEIKSIIQNWRNRFLTAKGLIQAATTLAELDSISL